MQPTAFSANGLVELVPGAENVKPRCRYTDAALALPAGTQLGPYEVVAPVGAGGMGEVYKVRDVRLSRLVAIKVLPAHLKDQPELRRRFLHEAQTIAALDHPHICVLHDIGSEADVDFLVMEYLEGETLAKRLEGGALPLEQLLRHAIEIGSALERAHRQGVVHRDLKPANIMVTKSGVKLLDFGLAKLRPASVISAPVHTAVTKSAPLTGAGAILGTLPYMAPEQLEGRDVDARTDIFAFGAVMYEMATGVRPFQGNSPASLIAAILEHTPTPICTRQPVLPRTLGEIVHRCLAKNPEERWQSASDLTFALTRVRHELLDTHGSSTPAQVDARRRWSGVALASISGLLLALVAFLVGRGTSSPSVERPPIHLLLSEQALATLTEMGPMPALALSRDGQRVVYVRAHDGVRRLYLRDLQVAAATALAGTENAFAPFFSPDGRRLGFFADGYLKVIATDGGAPVVLANAGNPRGGTWANDDTIIYSPGTDAGLWQVAASGGTARQLVAPDPDKGERSYRWPVVIPGHDAVVFALATSQILSFDDARLMVRSLATGEQRELVRGGSFPIVVASDLLLYSRGGALLAVPFDAGRQEVTGTATTLLDNVTTYPANGGAQYALAGNGTLIYGAGGSFSRRATLTWVDRTGASERLNVAPLAYNRVSLSRDGSQAALDIDGANASVWILDLPTSLASGSVLPMTRLTLEWSNNLPFWTPDKKRVGFVSARRGVRTLFFQNIDGASPPERLVADHESDVMAASLSPDGNTLVFEERRQSTGSDLWTVPVAGGRRPRPFLQPSSFNEQTPQFSPDGQWVAYVSDESGRNEVVVQAYPAPGRKWQVSTGGGEEPMWSATGRELFFLNGDAVMASSVERSAGFSTTRPEVLFRRKRTGSRGGSYAVAPDGRFLMIEDLSTSQSDQPVTVVLNWLQNVRPRLPLR